jgi:hypothetical protein
MRIDGRQVWLGIGRQQLAHLGHSLHQTLLEILVAGMIACMRVHVDTDFGGDPDDACAVPILLGVARR